MEYVQRGGVSYIGFRLRKSYVPGVIGQQKGDIIKPAHAFHFGKILFQRRSDRGRGGGPFDFKATVLVIPFLDTEDAVGVFVEIVEASFVGDVFKDQQAAGDADRQSEEVEDGVAFSFGEVADGDLEEAF